LGSITSTERSASQQVRDHRADTFARAGRGEGQEMRRAVIAQQLAGIEVAPDQQAVF
jgi:hypothetical protein